MRKQGLIRPDDWLDWGCGVGAVSKLLQTCFDVRLGTYDKYFTPEVNALAPSDLRPRGHGLVLNTAVFEHVRDRATLDEIEPKVQALNKAMGWSYQHYKSGFMDYWK